ncbi:hypothetical protein SPRG_09044 [Saprolegnia parasitica CBS 223.65]|uniref:Uncharacterized protein n=1 Tax=Saprolegnia parasitica (strain CBS 223.65) TaxID=695850 RepID=A0A067C9C6_SAPPC|nr:hypothetical protein SPRG_09044 [Saprolegnia parasitica CBS 223.65]KDO25745.1 hypothetical protein SPRG_09044 [Saprolegnia parasitica CBS 223.65]|eukprot:XP_012203554.1 hypothetical protein SPRG_09044 [Saprolegnia parasitica CBS 223.65]
MAVNAADRRRRTDIQRKWRQKLAAEIKALRSEASALEATLVDRRGLATMLPWRDVALTLADDSRASVHRNRVLRRQYEAQQQLLLSLAQRAMHGSPARPLLSYDAWHHTSLCAQAHRRRCALEWSTNAMLHNTSAMLEKHSVASSLHHFANYKITATENDVFEYVWHMRKTVPLAFESARRLGHDWVQQYIRGGMWPLLAPSIDLDVYGLPHTSYVQTTRLQPLEHVCFLSREFRRSETQTVIVGQTMHSDELHPMTTPFRHRMFWYVLECVSPTLTRVSIVHVTSHLCTVSDGAVPLAAEAELMGCVLTEHGDHVDQLTRHASIAAAREIEGMLRYFGCYATFATAEASQLT